MKRVIVATVFMAALLTGCGTQQPTNVGGITVDQRTIHPVSLTNELIIENHHFANAESVWRDGSWRSKGLYGPRYVISFKGISHIEVYNEDETPYVSGVEWVDYPCPSDIGPVTITAITNDGDLVHFEATNGKAKGTLNLKTRAWNIASRH